MPTIHREYGFNFVLYVDDHPPPHVHVTGSGTVRVTLLPTIEATQIRNLSKRDTSRILGVVQANREMMLTAWDELHG